MVVSTLAVLFQVDPTYTGRVGASEAALFLKKSGLSDIILGKVGRMKHSLLHASLCRPFLGRARTLRALL